MRLRLLLVAATLAIVGGGSAEARPDLCGCSGGAAIPDSLMPSWSPDGKKIAFVRYFRDNYDLYVMNADGTHRHALTNDESREANPDWSPDGRQIVFETGYRGARGINVIRPDGTGLEVLDGEDEPTEPSWSPDGRRIAYVARDTEDGRGQIAVMNADGSDRHVIVSDTEWHASPAWSPDGTQIAFEGGLDDAFIDVVNADGTGRRRLTFTGYESEPAWSPDGKITYTSEADDDWKLIVMNADGSNSHELLADSDDDWAVDWSADGRRFAFVSSRDDTRQIYVGNADGTRLHRLTGVRKAFTANHDRCTIVGTSGADRLFGTSDDDIICGLGGDDEINGGRGDDVVDGGAGADVVVGGSGNDVLLGSAGDDLLDARDGKRDEVDGGAGQDRGRVDAGDWIRLLEHTL